LGNDLFSDVDFTPVHLTIEALEQYALDQLPSCDTERVEEHLLVCPDCRQRLTAMEEEIRTLRAALRLDEIEERIRRTRQNYTGSLFFLSTSTMQ